MSRFPVDLSDLITGNSSGKELVTGSRQDDVIASGKGVKTLMGDTGEDDFVFFKKDRFGKHGADKIMDFDLNAPGG